MAAGPAKRALDGQYPGWLGHVRNVADATAGPSITPSDVTIYDPPLRLLRIGPAGAGTLVLVLDGDNDATANHRFTITVANNDEVDRFAIKQVRAASTATGILGFR